MDHQTLPIDVKHPQAVDLASDLLVALTLAVAPPAHLVQMALLGVATLEVAVTRDDHVGRHRPLEIAHAVACQGHVDRVRRLTTSLGPERLDQLVDGGSGRGLGCQPLLVRYEDWER